MWMGTSRGERETGTAESSEEDPRDQVSGPPDDAPEPGGTGEAADASAYWRRRFFILCGGVAALGLSAWLFPGAHQAGQPSAAARASMAAAVTRQALPAAATGQAWTPSPSASPAPKPAATPTPTPTRQKISLAYQPRAASASAASAASGGPSCSRIVLSLFTSQPSYSAGARPEFKVYAVSTAKRSCTLRYGAGAVQVVVTRQGRVVWNSAACRPAAARPVTFTPGVPRMLALTWNRGAAGPAGCAGSLPGAAAATLSAVVLNGGKSSPMTTFKIRAGRAATGAATSQSGKPRPAPAQSAPSKQYRPR